MFLNCLVTGFLTILSNVHQLLPLFNASNNEGVILLHSTLWKESVDYRCRAVSRAEETWDCQFAGCSYAKSTIAYREGSYLPISLVHWRVPYGQKAFSDDQIITFEQVRFREARGTSEEI